MKKIRVLFTGLSNNMGGIESFLINIYRNIDKDKFDVSFLIFKGEKVCFYDELKKNGVKFFEITKRKSNYLKFISDLKNVFKNNEFDFIHFNLVNFNCTERILIANKYSKAKIIIHSHNGNIEKSLKNKILHTIGKISLRKVNYIALACGEEAGRFLFNNNNFKVINNGINFENYMYDEKIRKQYQKELKIGNSFVMGLIARFDDQKNHEFLIDIFEEYLKLNDNAKLVLIGEGRLLPQIKNKVREVKIEDKVIFLGRRADANKLYSLFDIYIMPSKFEGLSISIVEAQVNGLTCYTSNNVDRKSNISGNVKFLDLNMKAKEWAKIIYEENNKRDMEIVNKIPKEYDIRNTVCELTEIYRKNMEEL